ncbi:MAG: fumarylacetoacetate hydrolase family protein, partial [Deltaproteobacteria bacterium]|nr:fumarylacetoacetate hydrolase family protein [Deltaproteobacteria bacterium]
MIERFVRFEADGAARYGQLRENAIRSIEGDIFAEFKTGNEEYDPANVQLLPPCRPGKIIALGLNYRDHARELGFPIPDEPLIFLKPGTAVIGPDSSIMYPRMSKRVDYEAELGVVIGQRARFIPREKAYYYIFGYTCLNDVTARDLQIKDGQFSRSLIFDTLAPI